MMLMPNCRHRVQISRTVPPIRGGTASEVKAIIC